LNIRLATPYEKQACNSGNDRQSQIMSSQDRMEEGVGVDLPMKYERLWRHLVVAFTWWSACKWKDGSAAEDETL
jgi:hypothetical protein